jgi:hypothetical protein
VMLKVAGRHREFVQVSKERKTGLGAHGQEKGASPVPQQND